MYLYFSYTRLIMRIHSHHLDTSVFLGKRRRLRSWTRPKNSQTNAILAIERCLHSSARETLRGKLETASDLSRGIESFGGIGRCCISKMYDHSSGEHGVEHALKPEPKGQHRKIVSRPSVPLQYLLTSTQHGILLAEDLGVSKVQSSLVKTYLPVRSTR